MHFSDILFLRRIFHVPLIFLIHSFSFGTPVNSSLPFITTPGAVIIGYFCNISGFFVISITSYSTPILSSIFSTAAQLEQEGVVSIWTLTILFLFNELFGFHLKCPQACRRAEIIFLAFILLRNCIFFINFHPAHRVNCHYITSLSVSFFLFLKKCHTMGITSKMIRTYG